MSKKLFVGNLDYTVTTDDLKGAFLAVGNLVDCVVVMDKFSGRSRGFGFVEFESEEDAKKALETLNGTQLKGREIRINEAKPQEPRDNGSGDQR